MDRLKAFGKRKECIVIWNIFRAVIACAALCISTGISLKNASTFAITIAFLFLFSIENQFKADKRQTVFANIAGGVYSLLATLGSYNTWQFFDMGFGCKKVITLIMVFAGLYVLITSLVKTAFVLLDKNEPKKGDSIKKGMLLYVVSCFCIIFFCWMLYFVAYYPALRTNDSLNQMKQVLGTVAYSNHHPIIHTMFLKVIYDAVFALLGNENMAIASTTLVQLLLLDSIFTYMLYVMKKHGFHKYFLLCTLVFIAFFPINGLFAVTMWKDVLFGGFVLLFILVLWQIIRINSETKIDLAQIGLWALLFLSGLLICLWRSNGFYAYVFCIPFFLLSRAFRKRKLCFAGICFVTVVSVLIIKGPVMERLEVVQPDFVEHISVPIQHISRVIVERNGQLPENDMELLRNVINPEEVKDAYLPYISDPMKKLIRNGNPDYLNTHKADFLKLWIRWGLKYPNIYLKAQIDISNGFWYPNVNYWVSADEITSLSVYETSLCPGLLGILKKINLTAGNLPLISILWKIGFYIWAELFCLLYCIKSKKSIILFLPLMAIFLSLLVATPVAAEFRYGYAFVTSLPFLIGTSFPQLNAYSQAKESTE